MRISIDQVGTATVVDVEGQDQGRPIHIHLPQPHGPNPCGDYQGLFHSIAERICAMSAEIDRLTEEVGQVTDTVAATKTLISGLVEQLKAAADDRTKLDALIAQLDSAQQDLANAVTQNTPTPPAPAPAPEPTPAPAPAPDGSTPTG
jgi:hypothetical protein